MLLNNNDEWQTTKEAAMYLKISPSALRILVHRKKVIAYKFGTRLRFKASDIISLLKTKEDSNGN